MHRRIFTYFLFSLFALLVLFAASPGRTATPNAVKESITAGSGVKQIATVDYLLHLEPVVGGIHEPVGLTHAGDGRLFVWQRDGIVRIIDENGALLPTPFLDISAQVDTAFWEQGFLGLTFHPNYIQNRYFYVNYTDLNGNTNVGRFRTSAADPNTADPATETLLLEVHQPMDSHNGGDMHFGLDGYLYIGLGDGGGIEGLPHPQDGQSLLGKMLRIDVDGGFPYAIPLDNPFVGNPDFLDEIYLIGLRNPWRFSIDRLTNDLYWGNVGGGWYEEVEYKAAGDPAGGNYGWPCYEGERLYWTDFCPPNGEFIFPITGFDNPEEGCAIVGGYVYRGVQYPEMAGDYLFADVCTGHIWRTYFDGEDWVRQKLHTLNSTISSFGEDAAGEHYVVALNAGIIYRVHAVPPQHSYLPLTWGN